jgi:nucleoside phosphorylase
MLMDVKLFASVGDVHSAEEFLASRQLIYAHDRRRYPFYFGLEHRPRSLLAPGLFKEVSTTSAIEKSLADTILGLRISGPGNLTAVASDVAARRLEQRENRAITYALFRGGVPDGLAGYAIRRGISVAYSKHHMALLPSARIIPGIFELTQLDADLLGPRPSILPQMGWILGLLQWADRAFVDAVTSLNGSAWRDLVEFSLSTKANEFRLHLSAWKRLHGQPDVITQGREYKDLAALRSHGRLWPRWQDTLIAAAQHLNPHTSPEEILSTVVIIHCVNQNERRGIVKACTNASMLGGNVAIGNRVGAEILGTLSGLNFVLVRTNAGSVGQDSAQGVVTDAIDDFNPRMVIAVGIAFGLKVQHSGLEPAVLVASSVKNYERVRVGLTKGGRTDIRDRGEVGNPDPIRLQKIRAVSDIAQLNVSIGQILSGEKLVDHPGFRADLRRRFPDALGGEMEASGVASSCARRGLPWLMIKAVSDQGDGSKSTMHVDEDDEQTRCANAAMNLVLAAAQAGCL